MLGRFLKGPRPDMRPGLRARVSPRIQRRIQLPPGLWNRALLTSGAYLLFGDTRQQLGIVVSERLSMPDDQCAPRQHGQHNRHQNRGAL